MKRCLSFVLSIVLILCLFPVYVQAASEDDLQEGMTEVNKEDTADWSGYEFYSVEDGSAVKGADVFLIPENGVTLLIFFSTTCGNCMADTYAISNTSWIQNERLHVIALETNYSTQEETENFLNNYAGDAKQYFDAYYGDHCNDLMWDYVFQFYDAYRITWPVLVLLTEENGVPKIRYASIGYQEISYISSRVEALLDEDDPGSAYEPGWNRIDGEWYYCVDGVLAVGWKKINSKWYYFDKNGVMQTGWVKVSGKWYYLESSGAMTTGWVKVSGKWYYMESSGAMVTGWKQISGKWYYFKSSGAMAASEWCQGWWLNANGTWTYPYKASWKKNSTGWWYEDTSGWYARNTTITIDGKSYTFNSRGYWVQ